MPNETQGFKQSLGLLDGTMLVAGSMIGSGIFIVSSDIVRNVGSAGWLITIWLLTGFLTLTAALAYGELSAMFPKAGGQYTYLREAYGKMPAFLYGWSFFAVIQTGTIAAVGVAFSKFGGYFFKALEMKPENVIADLGLLKIYPAQLVSILLIIFLTWINTRGVKEGKIIQTTFTTAKLLSLFGLIVFGFILAFDKNIWQANWANGMQMLMTTKGADGSWSAFVPAHGVEMLGLVAAAMVGSVFSSDAWNNVTFIAGEIKNPARNIGLSLFFGTLIVTVIYVTANLMYLSVLPLNEIAFAPEDRVAVAAAQKIFGVAGTSIIAIMIMVSTFGCNNGLILSGARVYYTMAKDKVFFSSVGTLNKNGVPAKALWIQCFWAAMLCLSGRYGDLLDYVVFVVLIFYILTIMSIFKLRRTRPDIPRTYKAFGYPVLPALYIVLAATLCVALLLFKPSYTWPGLGIVAAGVPLYFLAIKGNNEQTN